MCRFGVRRGFGIGVSISPTDPLISSVQPLIPRSALAELVEIIRFVHAITPIVCIVWGVPAHMCGCVDMLVWVWLSGMCVHLCEDRSITWGSCILCVRNGVCGVIVVIGGNTISRSSEVGAGAESLGANLKSRVVHHNSGTMAFPVHNSGCTSCQMSPSRGFKYDTFSRYE